MAEEKIKKNSKKSTAKKSTKDTKKKSPITVKEEKKTSAKVKSTKIKEKKIKKDNEKVEKKETKKNNENYFSTLEVIILIITTVIVSLVVGSLVTYNLHKEKTYRGNENLKKFMDNYDYITKNYYKDIDEKTLINGAIKGMIETLDDGYSYVIEGNDSDNFNIQLEGEYEGIGIEIISLEDGRISVYSIFEDSPAVDAGLKVGDIIKKVDDFECTNVNTSEVSSHIRGNSKKKFKLLIERDGEEKEITIAKRKIIIKAVKSKTFNRNGKKIGYIKLTIFSNSAIKQFKDELTKLEKDNIDSLIIDVRDNSGGHLTTATDIISLFLDSKHVLYQTNTKGNIKKFYSKGNKTKKYPIAVLQNLNSASASEMLSAALKEEYGAIIVGEKSYGKGTIQELSRIDNNLDYKITTKQWLTPKGNYIHNRGIDVDFDVTIGKAYTENPTDDNDQQLQKAIEELSNK